MVDLVDVVNMGLRDAGLPMRIAELYDGSEASKVALELLGQSRDEILRVADWSFSRRSAALTLLKGPPPPGGYSIVTPWSNTYAPIGFLFEYEYPDDMLDLRAIIAPTTNGMPDLDPVPAEWRVDNDPAPIVTNGVAGGTQQKVILCNINQAIAVYRARITLPSEWDTGFIAALVASLGAKFSTAFGADVNSQRQQREEQIVATQTGADVRG